jgi:isopenicillin-N N-acyltransferase like protein
LEVLIVANTIADVIHLGGCSVLVVEPARSATGGTLLGRNMDTEALAGLVEASLVIVRRPAGKHAFISATFPGLLACGSEMNDAGLVLAANDVWRTSDGSPKFEPRGTPLIVAIRQLMEGCASRADARRLLRDFKATTTGCAIMADLEGGAVYELTPKNVIVRPAEDAICVCTNHFCSKELAVPTEERCWRFDKLQEYRKRPKLSVADVAKALDEVNQGKATLHSMIFEPKMLRAHIAVQAGTAKDRPRKTLECKELFR